MDVIQEYLNDFDHQYAQIVTPFKFEYLNARVMELSDQIGFAPDQLRYVLSLFAMYPFAVVYAQLPHGASKHLYSIAVGIATAQFVLDSGWVHSFITSLITYSIVRFGPLKYTPYVVFFFNMIYMTASHIYRLYVDYMGWSLDFTGPQMLLVIKLTSFAYNYYDGVVHTNKLSSKVHQSRQKYAITKLPSLLEFFGYVYCFTTFLAGPAFEIREYLEVTQGTKFGKRGRPSCVRAVVLKFLSGIASMTIFTLYAARFPLSDLYSDENAARVWYVRIFHIWMALLLCRQKYYFAWKVAEGSTVLSGFGFEGYTDSDGKRVRGWNAVSNMDIIGFESAKSVREGSRAWNKGTQAWLERYVYSRTGNSLLATYFCSAFWHGFYPGYYLFFMSVPLATSVNRLAYKRLRPWFLKSDGSSGSLKALYDLLCIVSTSFAMNYLVMPFQALSWENSIKSLKHVNFAGHIILVVLFVLYSVLPVRKLDIQKTQ